MKQIAKRSFPQGNHLATWVYLITAVIMVTSCTNGPVSVHTGEDTFERLKDLLYFGNKDLFKEQISQLAPKERKEFFYTYVYKDFIGLLNHGFDVDELKLLFIGHAISRIEHLQDHCVAGIIGELNGLNDEALKTFLLLQEEGGRTFLQQAIGGIKSPELFSVFRPLLKRLDEETFLTLCGLHILFNYRLEFTHLHYALGHKSSRGCFIDVLEEKFPPSESGEKKYDKEFTRLFSSQATRNRESPLFCSALDDPSETLRLINFLSKHISEEHLKEILSLKDRWGCNILHCSWKSFELTKTIVDILGSHNLALEKNSDGITPQGFVAEQLSKSREEWDDPVEDMKKIIDLFSSAT